MLTTTGTVMMMMMMMQVHSCRSPETEAEAVMPTIAPTPQQKHTAKESTRFGSLFLSTYDATAASPIT